jgi:hypothetical protein
MRLIRETKTLAVFESGEFAMSGNYFTATRRLYVMLPKDESIVHTPMPLVTALVRAPLGEGDSPSLDWLETTKWLSEEWGQRLRDRMMRVLTRHLPGLREPEPEARETVGGRWDGAVHYVDTADGLREGDEG